MFTTLPNDVETFMRWTWAEIGPYFQDLEVRTLTAENVAEFLADWTQIAELVDEIGSRRHLATTVNTADEKAERLYGVYLDEIFPAVEAAEQELKEKLLASGLEPAGFEMPLRKMRVHAALFREANLPLLSGAQKLTVQYNKVIGAQTVQWEGQEVTVTQLQPVFQDTDRDRRERAWRLAAARKLTDRAAINALWQQFLALRLKTAANADFPDYRAYRWQQLSRFDYTPDDCLRFHQAIEETAVPAAARIYEKYRRHLGVETLRPWDLSATEAPSPGPDPLGRPPLRPFQTDEELLSKGARIFRRVDPQLGDYYDRMRREDLLDFANRKNKAPGAFCTSFPRSRQPFVFGNAVGLHDNVQTLLHECGHAFHNYERFNLPYIQQRNPGSEMAEVASMAMELLSAPYLEEKEGGFYSAADAARARIEHLEGSILFWPYMAVVDAFQHWVYESPEAAMEPAQCDAQWSQQWDRFMRGIDWSGLEEEKATGWHRKLHIHRYPFYYIEYGLAQLGAVQVWANALRDQAAAVAAYRRALALGGTVPLPQLYAAAGARLAFDSETLGEAVQLMEDTIARLES
jgi:oligoendopeptidase F